MKKLDIPPVWTILAILCAFLLSRVALIGSYRWGSSGALIALFGVLMILWPAVWFKRKKTTLIPRQKPNTLIVEGPFRISRNPMYLGMVLLTLGVGLALGSLTSVLPSIWLFWFLQKNYVIPEERNHSRRAQASRSQRTRGRGLFCQNGKMALVFVTIRSRFLYSLLNGSLRSLKQVENKDSR